MGQPAYLDPKGRGDHSMLVKRGTDEDAYAAASQDPRDKVKAELLEDQSRRLSRRPAGRASDACGGLCRLIGVLRLQLRRPRHGQRVPRRMSGLPKSRSDVLSQPSTGWPTGGDSYGHGVPVVVRGRESRPHGEGEQVARHPRQGGTRDA